MFCSLYPACQTTRRMASLRSSLYLISCFLSTADIWNHVKAWKFLFLCYVRAIYKITLANMLHTQNSHAISICFGGSGCEGGLWLWTDRTGLVLGANLKERKYLNSKRLFVTPKQEISGGMGYLLWVHGKHRLRYEYFDARIQYQGHA